jgi:hypothetical protein
MARAAGVGEEVPREVPWFTAGFSADQHDQQRLRPTPGESNNSQIIAKTAFGRGTCNAAPYVVVQNWQHYAMRSARTGTLAPSKIPARYSFETKEQ